jgi:hypothetical protein
MYTFWFLYRTENCKKKDTFLKHTFLLYFRLCINHTPCYIGKDKIYVKGKGSTDTPSEQIVFEYEISTSTSLVNMPKHLIYNFNFK